MVTWFFTTFSCALLTFLFLCHHGLGQMDFEMDFGSDEVDTAIASFFDNVIIPADKEREEKLRPHIVVGKDNATNIARKCSGNINARILEADQRLVIIGAGPAGLSAAIYAARAGMEPLVLSKDNGQLESTTDVDNYPGFDTGVDAIDLIHRLTKQAKKYGASSKQCDISKVEMECRPFRITCKDGFQITSSALIVATGASTKWLGVPGEQRFLSRGVHTCATCDGYFYRGKTVAVIGGGDTAMEQALFLARNSKRVTVIHRRGSLKASKAMATRVLNHPNIDIMWNTNVLEFIGARPVPEEGAASVVRSTVPVLQRLRLMIVPDDCAPYARNATVSGENDTCLDDPDTITEDSILRVPIEKLVAVEGAFVAIGHTPNTAFFKPLRRNDEGYIYTIPGTTLTSITGVYAAGDAADPIYRQAITSAGTGAMAAMDAERWLCEHGC